MKSVEILRKMRSHNLYTLRSTYSAYTRKCNSASNAEILPFFQQHAAMHLLCSCQEDVTSTIAWQVSKAERPRVHTTMNGNTRIQNPLYCFCELWRREILFTEQFPWHFISVLAKSGRRYASILYINRQHHGIHVSADYGIYQKASTHIQSAVTTHYTNY